MQSGQSQISGTWDTLPSQLIFIHYTANISQSFKNLRKAEVEELIVKWCDINILVRRNQNGGVGWRPQQGNLGSQ